MKKILCIIAIMLAVSFSLLLVSCFSNPNDPSVKSSSASASSSPKSSKASSEVSSKVSSAASSKTSSKVSSVSSASQSQSEVKKPDEDDEEWLLKLVNKQHQLKDDVDIEFGYITDSIKVDKRILSDLKAMIEAAKKDGIRLSMVSGYRTIAYQTNLFNKNVKNAIKQYGVSEEKAIDIVDDYSAPPKASEHSTGLAVDMVNSTWFNTNDKLYDTFDKTDAFKWLDKNAHKYGFIMRYPKGKEEITGYKYEPWHYRYVGKYYAPLIKESGKTLEEYLGK